MTLLPPGMAIRNGVPGRCTDSSTSRAPTHPVVRQATPILDNGRRSPPAGRRHPTVLPVLEHRFCENVARNHQLTASPLGLILQWMNPRLRSLLVLAALSVALVGLCVASAGAGPQPCVTAGPTVTVDWTQGTGAGHALAAVLLGESSGEAQGESPDDSQEEERSEQDDAWLQQLELTRAAPEAELRLARAGPVGTAAAGVPRALYRPPRA